MDVCHWRREVDDCPVNGDLRLRFVVALGTDSAAAVVVVVVGTDTLIVMSVVCLGELGSQLVIAGMKCSIDFFVACISLVITVNN